MIQQNTALFLKLYTRPKAAMSEIIDRGSWVFGAVAVALVSAMFQFGVTARLYGTFQAAPAARVASPGAGKPAAAPDEDVEEEPLPSTRRLPLPLVGNLGWRFITFSPTAVFTGGSLMVGGAGRTDLLGEERAEEMAGLQFASLRRLAALPPDVEVLPTHGAGSFCGARRAPRARTSTIGVELKDNDTLRQTDREASVHHQLDGLLDQAAPSEPELDRSGTHAVLGHPRTHPVGA